MKSTGEAMGVAADLAAAQYKAFLSTIEAPPPDGAALCSIADTDKGDALPVLRALADLGLRLFATEGTAAFLQAAGISAVPVAKLRHGSPTVVDVIRSGAVHLVVNTVSTGQDAATPLRDGFEIRRAAAERRIPCLTSLDTARALVASLATARRQSSWTVAPLSEYLRSEEPALP
jgi:carbamoyl-phosphate synthase large subunit